MLKTVYTIVDKRDLIPIFMEFADIFFKLRLMRLKEKYYR